MNSKKSVVLLALLTLILAAPIFAADVEVEAAGGLVTWQIDAAHDGSTLTVTGPSGASRETFGPGVSPSLRAPLTPGTYNWELAVRPLLSEAQQAALDLARARGTDLAEMPKGFVTSGTFAVADGLVQIPEAPVAPTTSAGDGDIQTRDDVIADDLIVQGSACVGIDCVNNESFGFDTIRLKENNLRIKFEDTSSGTFPSTDWQLTANDSASGGQNKFSIDDVTGATVPFVVEGAALTNSIYVDSTGKVGFRTATPVLDLHVSTANTPALRLEQNSSGGFTPQTWDVAGNEANFFVRDVTGGSRLSLRIRPGAPTSSIDIAADGDVGIGTASPSAPVHVSRSNATALVLIEETSSNAANQEMLKLTKISGGVPFMEFTSSFGDWDFSGGNLFAINDPADPAVEMSLDRTGNVTFAGSANATAFNVVSDVNMKQDLMPIDALAILREVVDLPLTTWSYKADQQGTRYLGPMAQDFKAAFGLGESDKSIATTNISGVALAAIQGLHQLVEQKDAELAELHARLTALEAKRTP